MPESLLLIDNPRPQVRRFTLSRPEKRNALSNALRTELLAALEAADSDDSVRVSIIRGAGTCFSSGYQLGGGNDQGQPYYTPGGIGQWPRHVIEGSFRIWDLAKPVIAQVHGYCLAGGSELATACDLVYFSDEGLLG
jgi:enoyl-CoA hydratase